MTTEPALEITPQDLIEMAEAHRANDKLEAGHFAMEGGKACSIGCFCADLGLSGGDFDGLAAKTGIPVAAHYLQEAIFEGLPGPERLDWHVEFFRKAAAVTNWDEVLLKVKIASLRIAGDVPRKDEWSAGGAAWKQIRNAFLDA